MLLNMARLSALFAALVAALSLSAARAYHPAHEELAGTTIERLHFASCQKHDRPQPAWPIMRSRQKRRGDGSSSSATPLAMLGDTVYADSPFLLKLRIPASSQKLERFLQLQKSRPDYAAFAAETPIVGVEDDHDAGINDAAASNIRVNATRYILDFFDEPQGSPRRRRVEEENEATFTSYLWGQKPRRVHLILLDNRAKRDDYSTPGEPGWAHQDILGEKQWQFLHDELKNNEAEVTIIAAGLQIVSRGDPEIAECWSKLPQSQAKLFALVASLKKPGVFFLSGDVHFTELSRAWLQYQEKGGSTLVQPLYDFTSSGLTHSWGGLLKTTVVRTAMMHTHRVREDGVSLGEERECGDDAGRLEEAGDAGAAKKPLYCHEALKREHERQGSGFSITPGPWSTGVGLGFRRKNTRGTGNADPTLTLSSPLDYARAAISSGLRDLFSSEQNFGEVDIDWATKTGEKEEVVDLDRTIITLRSVGLLGDYANKTLFEYSFPLRHIYPHRVQAPTASATTSSSSSLSMEGALKGKREGASGLTGLRHWLHSWFLAPIHPDGDHSPVLMNGLAFPTELPPTAVAADAATTAGCASSRLDTGFTASCASFMAFVGPHLSFDCSVRYVIGHFLIYAAAVAGTVFFLSAPLLIWVYRRPLNAKWPVPVFLRGPPKAKATAAREARASRTRSGRTGQTQRSERGEEASEREELELLNRAPWMWYGLFFALFAAAAAYLYSLG